jgi:hypothetical protein
LKWAARTMRYGLALFYDLTFGRLQDRLALPRDAIVGDDLGPFSAFAMNVDGVPGRTYGLLELHAGRWFHSVPKFFGSPQMIPLGDAAKALLTPGWFGTTLAWPGVTVLLPPRYRHLVDHLAAKTGAKVTEPVDRRLRAARAQASII